MKTALVILAVNAGVWAAGLLLLRARLARLGAALKRACEDSGEKLLLGPEVGYYMTSWRGIARFNTYGVIALTDRRLVFQKPIGGDIDTALSTVARVSANKWWKGCYRNGREWLILTLADGKEIAFQVKRHDRWMRALGSRVSTA